MDGMKPGRRCRPCANGIDAALVPLLIVCIALGALAASFLQAATLASAAGAASGDLTPARINVTVPVEWRACLARGACRASYILFESVSVKPYTKAFPFSQSTFLSSLKPVRFLWFGLR
jgi:hypothetical protein